MKIRKITVKNTALSILNRICVKQGRAIVTDLESQFVSKELAGDNPDGLYHCLDEKLYPAEGDLADYPELIIKMDNCIGTVNYSELLEKVKLLEKYASTDDTKGQIKSLLLTKEGALVATDGFRMANYQTQIDGLNLSEDIIIPAGFYRNGWLQSFGKATEGINIYLEADYIHFVSIETAEALTIRLFKGNYPDYKQVIPKAFLVRYTFDRRDLIPVLKELAPIVKHQANIIRLWARNGKLYIHARNKSMNVDITREIPITFEEEKKHNGENCSVLMPVRSEKDDPEAQDKINFMALNIRLLSDIVKGFTTNNISIGYNSALSPVLITPVGDNSPAKKFTVKKVVAIKEANINREVIATNIMYLGKLCNKVKITSTNTYITYEPINKKGE
jgi:DNA polymerase-3 subunit beta